MGLGVVYGNGCTCTRCKKILVPKEAIKVKVQKLSKDPVEASTGMYKVLGKMDLCESCYKELIKPYLEEPRITKKKEII